MPDSDLITFRKRDRLIDIHFRMINILIDRWQNESDKENRDQIRCEISDLIEFLENVK